MSESDWFLKKQAQLLQDLVDAKAVTLELLENLAVLSKSFLQQATENHIAVPNREAVAHLVRRADALLQASGETTECVLDGRPRDKLTPYLTGPHLSDERHPPPGETCS
jgi:lipid A disaccharide synthetase